MTNCTHTRDCALQFAYNEMSFFLIRLLQNFETISFDAEAQPPESRPPTSWLGLPGRKGVEKFWPKAHLTLYSEVGGPSDFAATDV